MAIYLVRHGETASNTARIVQTPDTPLSERGLQQVDSLARRLATAAVSHIVSSDLRRAVMTAERVQAATTASLSFDAGLQERNYGDIRGRAYASLNTDIFAPDYEPPGGESWDVFHARVDAVWSRVAALALQTRGDLAVITHGLVCYSLALRHLQLPAGTTVPLGWGNTSVTVVEAAAPWSVRVLNCSLHLQGAAASDPTA